MYLSGGRPRLGCANTMLRACASWEADFCHPERNCSLCSFFPFQTFSECFSWLYFFFFFLNFFLKRNTYKVGVLPCAFTVGFAQFTASLHSSVLFYFFVRSDLSIMMTRICFVFVFFSCIQKRPNFLGDYFNTLFRFVRFPPVDHRFRQPSTVHRCISHVLVGEKSHQFWSEHSRWCVITDMCLI